MDISGVGKSPNTTLSFRYNANNEELEELYQCCEDDPPTPQCDPSPVPSENASPKRGDRAPSIIDKYFKSIRSEKPIEKPEDVKAVEPKPVEESRSAPVPKEVTSSPMKEYLNRLGKRSTPEVTPELKEGSNETWKIFHDFKYKIAQAVEDMKTKSVDETKDKEKSVPRENSMSDSEENSAMKDSDQQSVGDTDNQVSSLESSLQNLSEVTQPLTAKATEREPGLPVDNKTNSDSSDDTHKNFAIFRESIELTREIMNDNNTMEVESGVEALEDTLDGFGDITYHTQSQNPSETAHTPPLATPIANIGLPPSETNLKKPQQDNPRKHFFNFSMYFLTFLVLVNYFLFPDSNIWNGFLLGLWAFCFAGNAKNWFLDNYFGEEPLNSSYYTLKKSSAMPTSYTIPSVKEHIPMKKYEGWINHYRFPDYDPNSYHINKTTTAFMKLEGCNLRISYTRTKISKRALWDEKIENIEFYQHRLYNLSGARVILLPKGLVRRRQWSKKYPLCIVLSGKEEIQVLERETVAAERRLSECLSEKKKEQLQHEMETETNASPEKRKKFVWRRREKSISHSDGETGKEGLRHRLVKKMHRDKKADITSTCTEPLETQSQCQVQTDKSILDDYNEGEIEINSKSAIEIDEDIDDSELLRIKDFLEEAELEHNTEDPADGEWSIHVRHSTDKQSLLYLFARTGREKHEWFRRLTIAISEASPASPETSAADDKTNSDPAAAAAAAAAAEGKDGIELAVYKMSEKETVAFAKNKTVDSVSDNGGGVTITSISQPLSPEAAMTEKNFWPYLLKIIQSKSIPNECECRLLPAEVSWVNTMLARIIYDVMRDPAIIRRVQNKIQRKLNTLKLPSFMSPLVVTELSLAGACPLVERVLPPAWDARGVWLDADLRYDGGAYIALQTQINLMKLKEKNITLEDQLMAATEHVIETDLSTSNACIFAEQQLRKRKPAIYDSEAEDSAESSSDDEKPPVQPVDSNDTIPATESLISTAEGSSSKKKFLRMVNKIATNKYFQQVTDYKYVKRAMEGLSNTDIKLHLEVHGLEGRLAINLPPPPHDRVWIGFRTNPQLVLKARPAVGARTLRFAHISNWIEQKLSKEFEKVLVLPNMEDFIIDVMTPTPVKFE